MSNDIWLTDTELAIKMAISVRTILHWRRTNPSRLPVSSNIGNPKGLARWRTRLEDINQFMRNRQVRQRAPKTPAISAHAAEAERRKQEKDLNQS